MFLFQKNLRKTQKKKILKILRDLSHEPPLPTAGHLDIVKAKGLAKIDRSQVRPEVMELQPVDQGSPRRDRVQEESLSARFSNERPVGLSPEDQQGHIIVIYVWKADEDLVKIHAVGRDSRPLCRKWVKENKKLRNQIFLLNGDGKQAKARYEERT